MDQDREPLPEPARQAEPGGVPDAHELVGDEERASKSEMPDSAEDLPAGDADRSRASEGEPGDNELGLGGSQSSPREPQGGL